MNNEIEFKLKKDYDHELVDQILSLYKNKPGRLKKDFHYIRQELYNKTKIMFLPSWLSELNYKDELVIKHDLIIEECLGVAPYKLNDELLYKLNENYKNKIPFFVQLKFFQNLKLTNPISISDMMTCFEGEFFIFHCREIYKKYMNFKKKWDFGEIEIGKKLKSINNTKK